MARFLEGIPDLDIEYSLKYVLLSCSAHEINPPYTPLSIPHLIWTLRNPSKWIPFTVIDENSPFPALRAWRTVWLSTSTNSDCCFILEIKEETLVRLICYELVRWDGDSKDNFLNHRVSYNYSLLRNINIG